MAQEPKFQKAYNLPLKTVDQIADLRQYHDTDTAVVIAGVELLHRTHQNRPGNEDLIRGL